MLLTSSYVLCASCLRMCPSFALCVCRFAGVMADQRYPLRRDAGGRRGAAFSTSIKLDRESGVPITEQLRDILVENAVRVIDLFRDWDEVRAPDARPNEATHAPPP